MKKKGQLTIFVIIGILIVVAGILVYSFVPNGSTGLGNSFGSDINLFVQDCLEKVSIETIMMVGQGGGYYTVPDFSNNLSITYYYYNGSNYFPDFNFVENEISFGVKDKLQTCVGSLSGFKEYEEINLREMVVNSEILDDEIKIEVAFPIQLIKGSNTIILEEFAYDFDVNFGLIYSVVKKIINEEPLRKGICVSCIFDYSLENDLNIEMLDSEKMTTIFVISDAESKDENKFEFVFANDYSVENGI